MAGKTPAQIKAEIKKLQDQLDAANKREAERIAGYAMKAKLHELDLTRDEWMAIFTAIARQRKQEERTPVTVGNIDPAMPVSSSSQPERTDGQ